MHMFNKLGAVFHQQHVMAEETFAVSHNAGIGIKKGVSVLDQRRDVFWTWEHYGRVWGRGGIYLPYG